MKNKNKKKQAKTSLQFKLTLLFFLVMVISSSVSICLLLAIFSPIMKSNAESQLMSLAGSIDVLEENGKYSGDEILGLVNTNAYTITKIGKYSKPVVNHIDELNEKGYYITSDGIIPSSKMITSVYDEYIEINSFSSENLYWMINFVIIIAFIVCIILGTVITALMSKSLLQPIRDINNATAEVARGNFNVRIKESKDKEYGAMAKSFNRMAKELAGIETLRGDFISSVSHEFKTPLASIQGFAKLLQDDNLTIEDRHEYTQVIIDETNRLTKLSSNILRLTKLENQTTIGKKTSFLLDEQMRKIIVILEPEWSRKNINLDIELEEIRYVGNEDLISQIWQNIINNAIKFTPVGGEIKVRLFRSETGIVAKISDNGPSIPADKIDKIFEKFYQGDKSRATEGNGLGLSLVKRIVDLSGGIVKVENLYEGGVCFSVELPYIIEDMG